MDPRALVVFLEAPYQEYRPVLASAREVILAGLTWPTHHWTDLAVSWIEQGAPIDKEIALALDEVINKKANPQHLRHRARSIVKTWRATGGTPNTPFDSYASRGPT
jgi:hypothetical protein